MKGPWDYPKPCVWMSAQSVKTDHLLNLSGYRIANRFRAATHTVDPGPTFLDQLGFKAPIAVSWDVNRLRPVIALQQFASGHVAPV